MLLNLFRPTPPKEILPKDFIDYERTRLLEDHRTRRQTRLMAFILGLATVGFCGLIAVIGWDLVASGIGDAQSRLSLFGQTVETGSIGVAVIFLAVVALVVVMRAVLKVMNAAARQDEDTFADG